MAEARRIMLGRLSLKGEEMAWTGEAPSRIEARVGEVVEIVVAYDYEEPTHDRDETRVTLSAEIASAKLGKVEILIEDSKVRDDSVRSHIVLPFRVERHGEHPLAWTLRVAYTRTPWASKHPVAKADLEERGAFRLATL